MSDTIETVKIIRPDVPGGYCIINKEDLKPEDVLFGEEKRPVIRKGKRA